MLGGYAGRVLRVDLSEHKISSELLDEAIARKYIGGAGLAAKILWDETNAETKPFSSENLLLFMIGPLTGLIPSSSRFVAAAISPLTNGWGQAHSGGSWAYELKHAGFDGVVFKGAAGNPVYLWIKDGRAELADASHVWGKDIYETDDILKKETDEKASIAAIGRAGEKLVNIACIMSDGRIGRAAARCGLGAVMGSKKLKAVAVRGTKKTKVNNDEGLRTSLKKVTPKLEYKLGYATYFNKWGGDLPIKNWSQGALDGFVDECYNVLLKVGKHFFCKTCRTSCGESRVNQDGTRAIVGQAIEPLGAMCLIDNHESLIKAFDLCQRYGLDTISTGGVIAFGMECFDKGLITIDDMEEDLNWGNHKAMVDMVRKIGEAEGFGKVLGKGVRKAAEEIGGLAREFAVHVKGVEFPAHDPRAFNSLAVGYATSNRGACHVDSSVYMFEREGFSLMPDIGCYDPASFDRFGTEGKGVLTAKFQNVICMINSMVCCNFLFTKQKIQPSQFVEWINHVTGWDMDLAEFLRTGERIFNLTRLFNVRHGISRKDDMLPTRMLTHKRGEGGAANNLPHLGLMLNEYYSFRGWSEEGIPTEGKLKELGLEQA